MTENAILSISLWLRQESILRSHRGARHMMRD
jgi:hypothetical protein